MRIKNFQVTKLSAPLIYPFRTALGQHNDLQNVLLRLEVENGIIGLGEAGIAPHITGESVAQTLKNLKAVAKKLVGKDVRDYRAIASEAREALAKNPAAQAAVEMALLDSVSQARNIPLWKMFGRRPVRLRSDITIVIAPVIENEGAVKVFSRHGFCAFKVKIGRDMDLDLQRVLAVARLAPKAAIYLDANQGYSASQTIQFLRTLKSHGVRPALIEQPVAKDDWEGMAQVTATKMALVCADESVRTLEDCRKLVRLKAAGAVNIKLMKSGFMDGARIAKFAKKNGLKLMIGAMMESNVAITAAAHFAAGLGGFDFIDLDPPFFIRGGIEQNPYLSPDGVFDLKKVKKGIGIDVRS